MMGIAADMIDMTIIETGGIIEIEGTMKEDKLRVFQGSDVVSKTLSIRLSPMKRFVRVVCIVGLAFCSIIGAGLFSTVSAGDGYYYGNRDHHYRERDHHYRYRRAYDHCAYRYRVDSHRFDRCMNYELEKYRRW